MSKKFLVIPILAALFFVSFGIVEASAPEESLSTIDSYKHSKSQFQSILNIIHNHFSAYTTTRIADLITYAYLEVKKDIPDISLYEVASDIKEVVINVGSAGTLETLTSFYITTKKGGYSIETLIEVINTLMRAAR